MMHKSLNYRLILFYLWFQEMIKNFVILGVILINIVSKIVQEIELLVETERSARKSSRIVLIHEFVYYSLHVHI